jgi:hypothetical protein
MTTLLTTATRVQSPMRGGLSRPSSPLVARRRSPLLERKRKRKNRKTNLLSL